MASKDEDLTNKIYGKLTVICKKEGGWECKCECGEIKIIEHKRLRENRTKSCGCYRRGIISELPGHISYELLFTRYKNNAKNRNHEFLLNREEHKNIIIKNCHYCGQEPKDFNAYCKKGEKTFRKIKRYNQITIERAWIKANGIDRVDNLKGYTLENSVPCCIDCNLSKRTKNSQDFIDHAYRIVKYQNLKKI